MPKRKKPSFVDLVGDLDVSKFKPGYWSTAVHDGSQIVGLEHEPMNGIEALRREAVSNRRLGRYNPETQESVDLRAAIERLRAQKAPPPVGRAGFLMDNPNGVYRVELDRTDPESVPAADMSKWLQSYYSDAPWDAVYPKSVSDLADRLGGGDSILVDDESADAFDKEYARRRSAVKKYRKSRRRLRRKEEALVGTRR